MTEKRKLLYWEGSSKKDFKEFPFLFRRIWVSHCSSCNWVGLLTLRNPGKDAVPESMSWWRTIVATHFA